MDISDFLEASTYRISYLTRDSTLGVPWRDTHLRMAGDAVNDLQLVFLTDWHFVTDEILVDEDKYFVNSDIETNCYLQVVASGPDTEHPGVLNAYFAAIASAKESIKITTPYFIPNESVLTALVTAALGGVEVTVIFPGISDSKVVQYSSRSYFDKLLKAGVNIYLYQKGFMHAKLLMVDGLVSSVGTANMDFRSFEQNLEVNALIYDRDVNARLSAQFHEDLKQSEKLTLMAWSKRSKKERVMESFARVFAPLL